MPTPKLSNNFEIMKTPKRPVSKQVYLWGMLRYYSTSQLYCALTGEVIRGRRNTDYFRLYLITSMRRDFVATSEQRACAPNTDAMISISKWPCKG